MDINAQVHYQSLCSLQPSEQGKEKEKETDYGFRSRFSDFNV